eukprot:scaffold825_cov249-Pinguiococcus_pyrenoidosus.AAC.23
MCGASFNGTTWTARVCVVESPVSSRTVIVIPSSSGTFAGAVHGIAFPALLKLGQALYRTLLSAKFRASAVPLRVSLEGTLQLAAGVSLKTSTPSGEESASMTLPRFTKTST